MGGAGEGGLQAEVMPVAMVVGQVLPLDVLYEG
jgi:hypothetical protein